MRPALGRRHLAHVSAPLDVEAMREAARALVGTHDFTSFAAREATLGRNAVRTIRRLDLRREGERIVVEVEGTGFLMHMVRTIAGSLVEVGRGREEPGWIARVLDARSREAAGPTAPPGGLTLVRVGYD
jgi:tRNA pseudouridine38-40 synthase